MLPVIAGSDPLDAYTFPVPLCDYRGVKLGGLRVAVWTDFTEAVPSDEVCAVVEEAADRLGDTGAELTKLTLPNQQRVPDIVGALYCPKTADADPVAMDFGVPNFVLNRKLIAHCKEYVATKTKEQIELARTTWLVEFQQGVLACLERHDVILSPVFSTAAVKHGLTWDNSKGLLFVQALSLVPKVPAGVVRCGRSENGMPLGVQVATKPYREDIALSVMLHLQSELGGWKAPPEQNFR